MGRSTKEETGLSEERKYRKFMAKQRLEIVLASLSRRPLDRRALPRARDRREPAAQVARSASTLSARAPDHWTTAVLDRCTRIWISGTHTLRRSVGERNATTPSIRPGRSCFSDQEFAEPVALSSTPPADVPLGVSRRIHSAYNHPVGLRPTRAPCSAQNSHYNGRKRAARIRAKDRSQFALTRGRPLSSGSLTRCPTHGRCERG
jgi:hypothetical protein